MSTTSSVTTNVTSIATTLATSVDTATTVDTAATTGVSSAATSLQSASTSTEANQSFSSKISTYVRQFFSGIANGVRTCLSWIPFIGKFFAKEDAGSTTASTTNGSTTASTTNATTTNASTTVSLTESEKAALINGQFVARGTAGTVTVPDADMVNYVAGLFGEIADPVLKLEVFANVVNAANSDNAIVTRFFNALPAATQTDIKYQAYVANGSDNNVDGVAVADFGQHVVTNNIRGAHMLVATNAVLTQARIAANTAVTTGPVFASDAERLAFVANVFSQPVANPATVVNAFNEMSDAAKIQAFHLVMSSANGTDAIATLLYNALSPAAQTDFRRHAFEANGSILTVGGAAVAGNDVGQHVVDNAIRSPLAQQAALRYLNALRA